MIQPAMSWLLSVPELWPVVAVAVLIGLELVKIIYYLNFHTLRKVPGPRFASASSLWLRWQRWNGRLSFEADKLLAQYGPVVRISPNMVLVNESHAVGSVFTRRDLDTAPTVIRALTVGGHQWTVTYPQNTIASQRRRPVMTATTTKSLRYWNPVFVDNANRMVQTLAESGGSASEDIVHHLRINTLESSQVVLGGSGVKLDPKGFPHVVGEYNFLVVWRLCLPSWMFAWLKYSPFSHARFRVRSSDRLFDIGNELCVQAEKNNDPSDPDGVPNVYQLFTKEDPKGGNPSWTTPAEIGAEMAGQLLAATETTSSALAFIFYELAKNPALVDSLYKELETSPGNDELESLNLLDACIKEGLRFRPPVALTGSRVVPKEGLDVLGYYMPQGTVLTTQSLSMSRQRPDLFPDSDIFNPSRWLDADKSVERRRLLVPFGVGSRRCPGGNMALFQMRLIIAAVVRAFEIVVAPETTPESMAPFEANGFRSRYDECYLLFKPRQ